MPKPRIGVLLVHGMGNQPPTFADATIEALQRRLGAHADTFAFEPAYWGSRLNGREDELYANLARGNDLDWTRIRRQVVIGGLGDAVAYAGPSTGVSIVYGPIHKDLEAALARLEGRLASGPKPAPLVILSHSLGCQIVSNYLWDAQHGRSPRGDDSTPFTLGETLCTLITFGCNLPLFTLALREADVKPIAFPGARALEAFHGPEAATTFAWLNVYDPDDVLGFPLKGISPAYADTVRRDIAIDTGSVFTSHTGYWTDRTFLRLVAEQLAALPPLLSP